jgi:hypothetical protein
MNEREKKKYPVKKYYAKYYRNHKKQRHDATTKYIHKIRNKAIECLGGKCSNPNCLVPGGCKDFRCLQIDHIYGNGNHDNRKSSAYYNRVIESFKKGERKYQLLCANCNWIKRCENKEYLNTVGVPLL